jgi:hypothetical protein
VPQQEAAYEEREFAKRFNRLVQALRNFSDTYNTGVINVKHAKAVRKAWQQLEKSGWFKAQKPR